MPIALPEPKLVLASDHTPVAVYDLGGDGPDLLVAHATGFCAGVMVPLASHLLRSFRCVLFDERYHGASGRPRSGSFSWEGFAMDAVAAIDALGLHEPYGFGHSCGGAALLLAEEASPGTFASLYCYEPVVFPGDTPLQASLQNNPLSAGALRRRSHFPTREDAYANFASKPPFDQLSDEALLAYVHHGFVEDPAGGIRLACAREDEAQVYAHGFSHDAFARLGMVACPVTLACGATTDAFGPELLSALAERLDRAEVKVLAGLGHFGPLQDPRLVAESVAEALLGPGGKAAGLGPRV
jgi:pimeloyl-ACP methyl ester carboxylesterase